MLRAFSHSLTCVKCQIFGTFGTPNTKQTLIRCAKCLKILRHVTVHSQIWKRTEENAKIFMLILFSFPFSSQHVSPRTTTSESPKARSKLWTLLPCSTATTSSSTSTSLSSPLLSSASATPNSLSATSPDGSSSRSSKSFLRSRLLTYAWSHKSWVWWISHLRRFWILWFGMGLMGLPLRCSLFLSHFHLGWVWWVLMVVGCFDWWWLADFGWRWWVDWVVGVRFGMVSDWVVGVRFMAMDGSH